MTIAKLGQRFTQRLGAFCIAGALCFGTTAQAQGLFTPQLYVNGSAITKYELNQRVEFLRVLNSGGNLQEVALKALTDERLQAQYAKANGITATDDEIKAGMEEFAARGQMTAEQLLGEFAGVGISAETYRDFVKAGVLWRKVIAGKYQGNIPISSLDVTRALEHLTRPRDLKVRLSELVIPFEPGQEAEAFDFANELASRITSPASFASAAREYSASASAQDGGAVNEWMSLSNLPPVIGSQVVALGTGKASAPILMPNAVLIFMVRDLTADERAAVPAMTVEYAEYWLPNTAEALAKLKANARNCIDLQGFASANGGSAVKIQKLPLGQVPSDIGLELAKLDPNEISAGHVGANGRRALMLCGRAPVVEGEINPDAVREQVGNQRLEGMVANLMEELRHAAHIRKP